MIGEWSGTINYTGPYYANGETHNFTLIINSSNLEKKSKLRNIFEKEKDLICVPFYPDNDQTLSKIAYNFFIDEAARQKNKDTIHKYM